MASTSSSPSSASTPAVATSLPLILAMYTGKFLFKADPAILLGACACAGARITTAAPHDQRRRQKPVPALGYTVTYAVGNTLPTICGMVIVMLLG